MNLGHANHLLIVRMTQSELTPSNAVIYELSQGLLSDDDQRAKLNRSQKS